MKRGLFASTSGVNSSRGGVSDDYHSVALRSATLANVKGVKDSQGRPTPPRLIEIKTAEKGNS